MTSNHEARVYFGWIILLTFIQSDAKEMTHKKAENLFVFEIQRVNDEKHLFARLATNTPPEELCFLHLCRLLICLPQEASHK